MKILRAIRNRPPHEREQIARLCALVGTFIIGAIWFIDVERTISGDVRTLQTASSPFAVFREQAGQFMDDARAHFSGQTAEQVSE